MSAGGASGEGLPRVRSAHVDLAAVPVRDVMRSGVVSFAATTPIGEALRALEEEHIGGAPVIGSLGELVGVLSIHDVLRAARERGDGPRAPYGYYAADPFEESDDGTLWADAESFLETQGGALGRDLVRDWMSPSVISVEPDAALNDVCEIMHRQGIHRVLVVEGLRLCGIVSTFDVVRFLASVETREARG